MPTVRPAVSPLKVVPLKAGAAPTGANTPPVTLVKVLKSTVAAPSVASLQAVDVASLPALAGEFILTVTVPSVAHCPVVGVNVRVIGPFSPLGLKVLLFTPEPVQLPFKPPWVVLSATGEPLAH